MRYTGSFLKQLLEERQVYSRRPAWERFQFWMWRFGWSLEPLEHRFLELFWALATFGEGLFELA